MPQELCRRPDVMCGLSLRNCHHLFSNRERCGVRQSIGITQNRYFSANWTILGFVTVPVIRPNDVLATGFKDVGSPYPTLLDGLANWGVFVKLKNSERK